MATLAADGFVIALGRDNDGRIVANAQDHSGETWTVRADLAYDALVELAQQVGFDLADG